MRYRVMGVSSPERVGRVVEQGGLMRGLSLDLAAIDRDEGEPRDFNDVEKAAKADRGVE